MKLLEYVKSKEFRVKQMKRGWNNWRKYKDKRRPTKDVWDGERKHFNKPIKKEDWDRWRLDVLE